MKNCHQLARRSAKRMLLAGSHVWQIGSLHCHICSFSGQGKRALCLRQVPLDWADKIDFHFFSLSPSSLGESIILFMYSYISPSVYRKQHCASFSVVAPSILSFCLLCIISSALTGTVGPSRATRACGIKLGQQSKETVGGGGGESSKEVIVTQQQHLIHCRSIRYSDWWMVGRTEGDSMHACSNNNQCCSRCGSIFYFTIYVCSCCLPNERLSSLGLG